METHLGRYEILEELGRGEMGVVYKGYDPLIDRFVAIKTIDLEKLDEKQKEEYKARFYLEAKAAGRLNHPNIITVYDLGRKGNIAYIAMELMERLDLQSIIQEQRPLTIVEKLDIAFQVAQGLAYAHEHGVVHRDIKPSNIMVLRGRHVKIADFGIARMESALWRTESGKVIGSPLYMSPEQIQSQSVTPRSDIFSFGTVLYRLMTGKFPFHGDNVNAVWYKIINEDPQKPSSLNHEIPDELDRIVARCLAKKPEDRYLNANELAADLHSCRRQLSLANTGTDLGSNYFEEVGATNGWKITRAKLIWIIVLTALVSVGLYALIDRVFIA